MSSIKGKSVSWILENKECVNCTCKGSVRLLEVNAIKCKLYKCDKCELGVCIRHPL